MADPRLAEIDARLRAEDAAGAREMADAMLSAASLAHPDRAAALMLRSRAHEALGRYPEAIADIQGMLALIPGNARGHNELGLLCADAGFTDRAIAAFTRATEIDPGYARAWNNLGNALRAAGRVEDSCVAFRRATRVDAGYALAWANLGATERDLGRDDDAAAALARALAIDPRQRVALVALGGVRRAQGQVDAAVDCYRRALAIDARDANVWRLLAGTLAERDDLAGARAAYAEAEGRDPRLIRATLGRHLVLPMVPASAAAAAASRQAFEQGLSSVERSLPQRAPLPVGDALVDELGWANFLLAYQGEDDRLLQQRFAAAVGGVLERGAPEWRVPRAKAARQGRRLRVGFVSAFFREGTVGRYFEHWVTDLPRDTIEVCVYHLQPARDAVAQRLAARADRFRHCPRFRPSQIARAVREDAPDVLVYPELGMDATTFALAALRLAPLQCAAWGHPVTSGQPTIDVFFSSAAMEPDDADRHYSERLVRLPGIGTRYRAPVPPAPVAREALGLPGEGALFLYPQSLFKIAPDDDDLLAAVLAAAPAARVVLFEGRHPALTAAYLTRLDGALAAHGVQREGRLLVLPQCRHDRYLAITRACDAMLDTQRWSGGNTSLDAIACGVPIVAFPGRFMRARQSAGMLRLAEVPELVASDASEYVSMATRLIQDRDWQAHLSRQLLAGGGRIFDDAAPVAALTEWLLWNG